MSKALGIALRRSGVICDHADHDRARTEGRKHAGRVNIGNIAATEDAARRRFTAAATPTFSHVQPPAATGSRELSIDHLETSFTCWTRRPRTRTSGWD